MEDALEAYRRAVSLNPDNATAYIQQAKAFRALGKPDETIRSLKTALKLDPEQRDDLARTFPELYRDTRVRKQLGFDR